MAGILTFTVSDDLKAMVAHTRAAARLRPMFAELYDPALRLDGREPGNDDPCPTQEDIDPIRIPKGLWLVMDDGVYLMSPADPALPGRDGKANLVVYARECDPAHDGWWEAKTAIVGGDDGVDKLDLEFFEEAIAGGATTILAEVSDTSLSLTAR
jgi:hypothetical protein